MDEKQIAALREVFEAAYVRHMNSQEIASTWGQRDYTAEEIAAMREGGFYNVGVEGVGQHHGYLNGCWWGFIACYQHLAPQWLPIETAPKDGTEVMLAKGDRVTQGQWVEERWPVASEYHGTTGEYLGQYETGECIEAHWMTFDGGFADDNQPTHWMPLPAAPDAAREQEKKTC